MNQKQEIDLWEQISIPSWMLTNPNNFDQNSIFIEQNQNENEIIQKKSLIQSEKQSRKEQATKRKSPLNRESEYNQSMEPSSSDPKADESLNSEYSVKRDITITKNKLQRRCENSKKYRQKKKQYFKALQEENSFLKFKVQELTFKLHEMEMEINRLKHNDPLFTHNFHTVKSDCLKEIEQLIAKNADDINECIKAQNKLNKILAFDGKQKIDYLNYFMNELLENVINDRIFYFVDCLIHKRGVHREGDTKLRRIDLEVFEILKTDEILTRDLFTDNQKSILRTESKRLQQLWKKLYQVYLAILNQGLRVEKLVQSLKTRLFTFIKISDFLRLQLHFQENKHRADIRNMRNSWYREVNEQQACKQPQKNTCPTKKTKLF